MLSELCLLSLSSKLLNALAGAGLSGIISPNLSIFDVQSRSSLVLAVQQWKTRLSMELSGWQLKMLLSVQETALRPHPCDLTLL